MVFFYKEMDLDFFVYGLSSAEATKKLDQIKQAFSTYRAKYLKSTKERRTLIDQIIQYSRTKHTVTFHLPKNIFRTNVSASDSNKGHMF